MVMSWNENWGFVTREEGEKGYWETTCILKSQDCWSDLTHVVQETTL